MARLFVDTSALIKLYRSEPRSSEVQACIVPDDLLILSGIAVLEYQSAFFGLVRQNLISRESALQRIALFQKDLPNFTVIPLTQKIVESAEILVERFGAIEGLRPADALQLACALEANSQTPLDSVLTTDNVLARCAAACGLTVRP